MEEDHPPAEREDERTATQEPHEPPRLIDLGSYLELTQGPGGITNPDGVESQS